MIGDNVRRKLEELIARAPALMGDGGLPRDPHHVAKCLAWITEVFNAIVYAIPSPQNPYRARIEGVHGTTTSRVAVIFETLRA
jgi:hypothetical protein